MGVGRADPPLASADLKQPDQKHRQSSLRPQYRVTTLSFVDQPADPSGCRPIGKNVWRCHASSGRPMQLILNDHTPLTPRDVAALPGPDAWQHLAEDRPAEDRQAEARIAGPLHQRPGGANAATVEQHGGLAPAPRHPTGVLATVNRSSAAPAPVRSASPSSARSTAFPYPSTTCGDVWLRQAPA